MVPPDKADQCTRTIIDIVINTEDFNSEKFIDHVAATCACKASIKAHDPITETDMIDLLDRIRTTKNPFTCPHGRPTIISYSYYELEKMFKRVMD